MRYPKKKGYNDVSNDIAKGGFWAMRGVARVT